MHSPNDRQRSYADNPLVGEYKIRLRKKRPTEQTREKKLEKGKILRIKTTKMIH
jgi:hypothetical protein